MLHSINVEIATVMFVHTSSLVVNVVYIHDYQVVFVVVICRFHEEDVG